MKKLILLLFVSSHILTGCGKDDSSDNQQDNEQSVANRVNSNFTVVGGFSIDPETLNETSNVEVTNTNDGRMPLVVGNQLTTTINFTPAADTNGEVVDAVGMRFGNTGDIIFKPITPAEAVAGSATMTFTINPSVCNDIAQICHDMLCYEFAKTSAGNITPANFQDVALLCGACEEPSCRVFCCEDGMTIMSTNIDIDGVTLQFNDCDVYVSTFNGDSFSIGEATIFDDTFDPNSRRIAFFSDFSEFENGLIISEFFNGNISRDVQVDRHIDDTNLSIYHAADYSGNDQGNIEIITIREGPDQFGNIVIVEFEVRFNNLIVEEGAGGDDRMTINGTLRAVKVL